MNPMRWRLFAGGALILFGLIALLGSLPGVHIGGIIWAAVFGVAGLAFLFVLVSDKRQWWASFPGFVLLGIGVEIAIGDLTPALSHFAGGVSVLGGIFLAFLVVFLLNRTFWWALIPAGVMLSIILMILIEPISPDPVWIFFLGLGATFGALALVPTAGEKRMTWPLIPAAVMLIMGIAFMIGAVGWAAYIWPGILIALGVFFVLRAFMRKA